MLAAMWSGRIDGEGPEHARWHQLVRHETGVSPHITLLGFASDEGVRRNQGRVGAAEGPTALRGALAPLAAHGPLATGQVGIVDGGDISVADQDLEAAQEELGLSIGEALAQPGNQLCVVLGGGHETAWASYLGLMTAGLEPGTRWGVVNLDAHFDLRDSPEPSSGTPFAQMARAQQALGEEFRYAVVGISRFSNTATLFQRAAELDVPYLLDVECTAPRVSDFVADFIAELDVVYLTIDLDVLPAAVAPGVSAPAALGVAPGILIDAIRTVASSDKLALLDVVELNPRFDIDQRTAKIAARMIAEAAQCVAERFAAKD